MLNKIIALPLLYRCVFFLFLSCTTKINKEQISKDTTAISCASVCKAPSRETMIRSALIEDNRSSKTAGTDTGKMVLIKGGAFEMGSENFPDARSVHKVTVSSFYMDVHEVTNDQFAKFVAATHYLTVAERPLNPKDYPGVPSDKLAPGSANSHRPTTLWRWTIPCSGGLTQQAPTGGIRKARNQTSKAKAIIP